MIDLSRQPKKQEEEPIGMVLAGLIPMLVIILCMMMWRLG